MNSKYLKYAIGEIALVVIGILIALSINNWNEKRKYNKLEETLMEDMLSSLRSDQEIYDMLSGRLDEKDQAIQLALDIRNSTNLNQIQVDEDALGKMFYGIRFSYDESPYESMIALGIDKLSDEALRKKILYYYKVRMPRSSEFIQNVIDSYDPKASAFEKRAHDEGLYLQEFKKDQNGKWFLSNSRDIKDYIRSDLFMEYITMSYQESGSLRGRLKPAIEANSELIELIELYLGK